MKRWQLLCMLISLPLMLLAVVWQAGHQAMLFAEARELQHQQESWVAANEKLVGGIAILESRERASILAGQMGLERATASRRIFIETADSPVTKGAGLGASPAGVKGNG